MFMLMLCVEENLLKQAALVHNRDIYTLNIKRIDSFVELLFSICLYTYQNPPTVSLAVTVLYWKAWQILLIITALRSERIWFNCLVKNIQYYAYYIVRKNIVRLK
jgi:hypothetical protein